MGSYTYTYLMEYVPVRFHATIAQEEDRRTVYSFKDGHSSDYILNKIVACVQEIKNKVLGERTRVCFIPASTSFKTIQRYKELSARIVRETGCPCSINTITKQIDEESGHIVGKKLNPAADFDINRPDVAGMNIILIDDVITRGRTFCFTADKLINNGAKRVYGLFLAKTIHPCENVSHIA